MRSSAVRAKYALRVIVEKLNFDMTESRSNGLLNYGQFGSVIGEPKLSDGFPQTLSHSMCIYSGHNVPEFLYLLLIC